MSVKVDLKLTRLTRLAARLAPDVIDEGAKNWADAVADRARELVPVDTGALRSSIHTERSGVGVYQVVADTEYAAFVEYGTSRAPAQPYLTPASRQVAGKPFFVRALVDLLR